MTKPKFYGQKPKLFKVVLSFQRAKEKTIYVWSSSKQNARHDHPFWNASSARVSEVKTSILFL